MSNFSALEVARETMMPFLKRLIEKEETQAVCVLSSGAGSRDRAPFDRYSDFDVGLVLDVPVKPSEWRLYPADTYRLLRERVPHWLPGFSFAVPVPWGLLEVNVNQLLLAYEEDDRTTWDDEKCEAYGTTAEILFDRDQRFTRVIGHKLAGQAATRPMRRARLVNRLEWDISILPKRQLDRGEVESAHLILDRAANEIIELVFVAADRFLPNPKWRFFAMRRYALLSESEIELLIEGLRSDPGSMADLARRIGALGELWERVRPRLVQSAPDQMQTFTSRYVQIADHTFGEICARSLGEAARNIVDFLAVGSYEELLRADISSVPCDWKEKLAATQAKVAREAIGNEGS